MIGACFYYIGQCDPLLFAIDTNKLHLLQHSNPDGVSWYLSPMCSHHSMVSFSRWWWITTSTPSFVTLASPRRLSKCFVTVAPGKAVDFVSLFHKTCLGHFPVNLRQALTIVVGTGPICLERLVSTSTIWSPIQRLFDKAHGYKSLKNGSLKRGKMKKMFHKNHIKQRLLEGSTLDQPQSPSNHHIALL